MQLCPPLAVVVGAVNKRTQDAILIQISEDALSSRHHAAVTKGIAKTLILLHHLLQQDDRSWWSEQIQCCSHNAPTAKMCH